VLRENFCSLITIVLDFSLLCWFRRLGAPGFLDLPSVVVATASAPANQITPHSNVMVYMEFPRNIEGTSAKKMKSLQVSVMKTRKKALSDPSIMMMGR